EHTTGIPPVARSRLERAKHLRLVAVPDGGERIPKECLSMRYRLVLCLLAFALPGVVRAQEPEQLLPATTQVYLRWDGVEAHRAAYEKTALGKMMKGDTGEFVSKTF